VAEVYRLDAALMAKVRSLHSSWMQGLACHLTHSFPALLLYLTSNQLSSWSRAWLLCIRSPGEKLRWRGHILIASLTYSL